MLTFKEVDKQVAHIKVVGIGGGGGNAVDHMAELGIDGVDFAAMNTDIQSLAKSIAPEKIQIGKKTTRGMGTGGNPELGRQAALDDKELITEMLDGVNIIFITAGFGGGTGTGAATVVAQIARDMGVLTVGIVTKPFTFEGRKRMAQADQGLKEFREQIDTIICIPNDKLFDMISQDTPLFEAYRLTDQILFQAVESISQVIIQPGLINLDFADIRTVLSIRGGAVIGFGEGSGKDKAAKAIQAALASPLLETKNMHGATGILISIIGGPDLSLYEVNNAIGSIHEIADDNATIIIGTILQPDLKDKAQVTLIATGLATDKKKTSQPFTPPTAIAIEPTPAIENNDEIVKEPKKPVEKKAVPKKIALKEPEIFNEEPNTEEFLLKPLEDENIDDELVAITTASSSSMEKRSSQDQNEFFEKSDPTVYKGSNLDIPSFLRKKRRFVS